MNEVTLCLTSCGRPDLLQITLESFFKFNTYPIQKILIIDDSGLANMKTEKSRVYLENLFAAFPITWIYNTKNEGQIACIDKIYSMVKTPFIFHCEDDWEFYKSGFIETSLPVLKKNPQCIQVWLRELYDTNGHPLIYKDKLWQLTPNYLGSWHGFSFNPGLRRLSDYRLIKNYSLHTTFDKQRPWQSEASIGEIYKKLNFFAAILPEGYVRHIGSGRHVD